MIIDTNIYSGLQRADNDLLKLVSSAHRIAVPFPVIAELRAGYLKGTRTGQNLQTLSSFLDSPEVSILEQSLETIQVYSELQVLCWSQGRALSQNDIWIAALAREDGDMLVTYDQDFRVFQALFGDKLTVLLSA